MWEESNDGGKLSVFVCSAHQLLDEVLMSTMHTIENANGHKRRLRQLHSRKLIGVLRQGVFPYGYENALSIPSRSIFVILRVIRLTRSVPPRFPTLNPASLAGKGLRIEAALSLPKRALCATKGVRLCTFRIDHDLRIS